MTVATSSMTVAICFFNQLSCEFSEFPLYANILTGCIFLGFSFLGVLLLLSPYFPYKPVYRFAFGGLLVLIGCCGLLSSGGAFALGDPLFWVPQSFGWHDPYRDNKCGEAAADYLENPPAKSIVSKVGQSKPR